MLLNNNFATQSECSQQYASLQSWNAHGSSKTLCTYGVLSSVAVNFVYTTCSCSFLACAIRAQAQWYSTLLLRVLARTKREIIDKELREQQEHGMAPTEEDASPLKVYVVTGVPYTTQLTLCDQSTAGAGPCHCTCGTIHAGTNPATHIAGTTRRRGGAVCTCNGSHG